LYNLSLLKGIFMQVFIAGTDTNIGKTTVSSWLSLHTGYDYFKPIQTGCLEGTDSQTVSLLTGSVTHPESYCYEAPFSPHQAASLQHEEILLESIKIPAISNLIIEGAGGLLVPINRDLLIIDLIKHFSLPVILVSSSRLGTINHTLLSLEALRKRDISLLGVIVNGELNQPNVDAIEFYGQTNILAQVPFMENLNRKTLSNLPLTPALRKILD
jgi:dethiobiotin synthetase